MTNNMKSVESLVNEGWKIVSDGPSGTQLEGPKKMKGLDKVCFVFGVLTFWVYGIGFFFMLIAGIDYWFLTKAETKFIAR